MDLRNVSQKLLLTGLLSLLVAAGQAQVKNSGFELGNGTQATDWTSFGNAYREQTLPRSGAYDLKLYGGFNGGTSVSGAYQNVPMMPGQTVEASTWAVHRNADAMSGDNFAVLKVIYRNAANVDLAAQESKRITASTARDQFQFITASLEAAPAGTTHCAVFLLFIQPASTPYAPGSVLFDDLDVRVISPGPRKLVFQDNFDGNALKTAFWEPQIGDGSLYGLSGWGNNELQYYTDRPANLVVGNGLLRIIAKRENFGGKAYTSARLRTKGKVDTLYGRVEARMKVPAGQGLWPAFWMLPTSTRYGGWAASGEIDILETINAGDRAYQTIHFGGTFPNQTSSGSNVYLQAGYAAAFHTYAIEWKPDSIRWSIDGVETYVRQSIDWYSSAAFWNQRAPFDEPFYILLNLAVGGNWPGSPDGTTPFPAELQVDWVKVFRNVTRATSASGQN